MVVHRRRLCVGQALALAVELDLDQLRVTGGVELVAAAAEVPAGQVTDFAR
jgi:hypothetical protein